MHTDQIAGLPMHPADRMLPTANWLRQWIAEFRRALDLKRQERLLSNLDPRVLADMGIEVEAIRQRGPQYVYLMPHLVVGAGLYGRGQKES